MASSQLTVILPAYNAETTIAAAIQSVLFQSYPDFELWVLESNSTDRTVEIAKSFSDTRVKVFQLGSLSFQDTLVYALETANTKWLVRMDADDLSFPGRLEAQMQIIEQQPDLVLVGTRCVYLTPFGHIIETRPNVSSREIGPLNLRLLGEQARFFADASVIFNRRVALEVGGYDSEFQMGDVPLWFRMLQQGRGWEIATPLYLYRLRPQSMGNSQVAPTDELFRFLVKYSPDLLHLHFPDEKPQVKSVTWHQQQYWLRIAAYEALTGDRGAILQAVAHLEQEDGLLKRETMLIRWFARLGAVVTFLYKTYRRNKYRHRPDLEQLFAAKFESLVLTKNS